MLRDAHGEPDVVDEATSVGFLVRSAFGKDDRTLVGPVPADLTVPSAPAVLAKLRADHAVLLEISREGTTLRATILIVDPDGLLIVTHVNAGDGDVARLAELTVDKIAAITHALASPVPKISLGRLRPFAIAARTGDPAALVDGSPATALAVPAIGPALAALPPTALGARAIASRAQLDALPHEDIAAHAFAAIDRAEVTVADAALGKPAKNESGQVILARAMLADLRNDIPALQRLIFAGIASDQPRATLAFASSLPPGRVAPEALRAAVAAVDAASPTAGVVSRLGLLAAEAKLDGALALIAVRELDDAELARLIPLIEVDPDVAILRLRAEVSMRRADGHQETAIAAFLAATPNDVRAHLDHGYVDMVTNKLADAAAEFDTAGNQRLHTRALFVAKELAEAAKGFDKPASAEELAIAALLAPQQADAEAFAERADKLAPGNALVQRAVEVLAVRRGDAARAKYAKQIADEGHAPAFALAAQVAQPPPPKSPVPKPRPAPHVDDDAASSSPMPIVLGVVAVLLAGGLVVFVIRRRRGNRSSFVPVPVSDEPVPLEQLVIEAPPMPEEPEAEPFADFPFALDPEPPPPPAYVLVPEPEPEPELELAPHPEELVLEDVVPPEPIAVSFRAATPAVGMPVIPRTMTPLPASGPIDLFDEPVETMPGLVLERYRTTRELGRGAMGVVYRAWDTNLEREVAIKVMAEELRTNVEALQLFTQEAKSLAQLNHANIVTIYDQVTIKDKVYMIMELVDGTTLEDTMLTKKIFKWRDATGLVDQLCAGLAYAHARKIIHRDIKPANIFMTSDGGVKLGDFGLARVMRELRFRATEVRGTPLYMAPEQITGTDIDHRTDLYAVGCTLYELVTGRPPFIDGDILYQQVHTNPIPPSMLVGGVPQLLERLIMSLLAKQLDGRPRSANEVRSVLKSVS